MFCGKCGSEILNDVRFCPKCGNAVETKTESNVNSIVRKRHGFTSFWLIFGMITSAISGVIQFIGVGMMPDFIRELTVLSGIVLIAGTICYVLLLRWKKIGFWIIVGLSIISILILPIMIPKLATITGAITGTTGSNILSGIAYRLITVAIIWGVLHIRKNGKNTWEQLIPISKYGWF